MKPYEDYVITEGDVQRQTSPVQSLELQGETYDQVIARLIIGNDDIEAALAEAEDRYNAAWKSAVEQYEFARGVTSGFPYIDYYSALATVRGAIARKGQAVAFAVEPDSQRRVLDSLP